MSGPFATTSTAVLIAFVTIVSVRQALGQGALRPTDAELEAIPRYQPSEMGTGNYPSVDLRKALIGGSWQQAMPAPGNQGRTNTCTAWAVAYALKSYHEAIDQGWIPDRSERLFSPSYVYNQINGGVDKGSSIPNAMKAIMGGGCATMASMPFTPDPRARPSSTAMAEALKFRAAGWSKIQTGEEMRQALMRGDPVALSIRTNHHFQSGRFAVYDAREKARGDRQLAELLRSNPAADYKHGHHAVLVVGFDDTRQAFLLMNSWGSHWGGGGNAPAGHCWIHYDLCRQMSYGNESLLCSGGFVLHDLRQRLGPDTRPPDASTPPIASGHSSYNGFVNSRHNWSWTVFLTGSEEALRSVGKVTWHIPGGGGKVGDWVSKSRSDNFTLSGINLGVGSLTAKGTVHYTNGKTSEVSFRHTFTKPTKKSLEMVQTDKYWGLDPQSRRPTWEWTVAMRGNLTELHQVASVTWHLHPTFRPPDRTVVNSPTNGFAFTTRGWGTFPVKATVVYKDGTRQQHSLLLKFHSPVVNGLAMDNTARFVGVGPDNVARYSWTVFVRGPEGLMQRVRSVRYFLHPTFPVNIIDVSQNGAFGFPFSSTGWGTFDVKATVTLDDGTTRNLVHRLKF